MRILLLTALLMLTGCGSYSAPIPVAHQRNAEPKCAPFGGLKSFQYKSIGSGRGPDQNLNLTNFIIARCSDGTIVKFEYNSTEK